MIRTAFALLTLLVLSGCATVVPIEAPPEEVRRMIREEGLLEPGERVQLVTADGARHRFRVSAVDLDAGVIRGFEAVVSIDAVVAAETRKVAAGRTAALAAGLYVGIGAIIAIAIAPAVLLGAGAF
jgi:hypothetical protein